MTNKTMATLDTLLAQVCEMNSLTEPLPGVSKVEVRAALRSIGLEAPDWLSEIYQWHNGIWEINALVAFLPLAEAVSTYESYRALKEDIGDLGWQPSWFPLIDMNGDVQLCVDVVTGEMHAVDIEFGRVTRLTSHFENLVAAIAELFKQEAYSFDEAAGNIEPDAAIWSGLKRKYGIADPGW